MDKDLEIVHLADLPKHLWIVSYWIFKEWGYMTPGTSLAKVETQFANQMRRNSIPFTRLALLDGEPVGTASLVICDMTTRQDLSPWLAGVYVIPDQRGKGIGSRLVQAIEVDARGLMVHTLYLSTPNLEGYYSRRGWNLLEKTEYRRERVSIMYKDLIKPKNQLASDL